MSVWIAIAVGLAAGVISGFGIGGGSLLLLYLTLVQGLSQFQAGGINLLYFLGCAPTAIGMHLKNKLMDLQAVKWSLWGVLPCAAAAWLASVMPTDWLRRGFGVLLLYIGLREVFGKKKSPPEAPSDKESNASSG